MRAKKKWLLGFGVLFLLTASVAFLIPTTRLILVGYLTGEPFHKSRPLGFWIHEAQADDRSDGGWSQSRAAIALGEMGPLAAPAIPALTAALRNKEQQVRREAAFALGKIGPDASATVPAIIEATALEQEWDNLTLSRYAGILVAIGPTGIPEIVKALRHEKPGTRWCAALAITQFGPKAKEAIPALIEIIKDPQIQENARRIEHPSELKGHVFYQCTTALGNFGLEARDAAPVIVGSLKSGVTPIFGRGGKILYDDEPLAALAKTDPDFEPFVSAMPRHPPWDSERHLARLIDGLRHEKRHVREFAAFVIGWCTPRNPAIVKGALLKSATTELTRLLADDDENIRWSAAIALVRVNEGNQDGLRSASRLALPVLIETLSTDKKHARVRYLAADTLAVIGTRGQLGNDFEAAAPALALALNDSEHRVRRIAMIALAEASNRPEHVQAVVRCAIDVLKSKESIPRDFYMQQPLLAAEVIEMLGRIGPDAAAAVPLLIEMAQIQPDPQGPQPEIGNERLRAILTKIDPQALAKARIK